MKKYITFGYDHAHAVNGKTFDKDCVAVIECDSPQHGRDLAFKYFGPKFAFEYSEDEFSFDRMRFYWRGFIEVN